MAEILAGMRAEIGPAASLASKLCDELYSLLSGSFDGVKRDDFESDLSDKQKLIVLRDGRGRLQGFSTLRYDRLQIDDKDLCVAFFGDTVMRREAWGSPAFPRAVITELMDQADRVSPLPLYTLLICSGYRTYRFMPFFCNVYSPAPGEPEALRALRNTVALRRFGNMFDVASGVIWLKRGAYALKDELAEVEEQRLKDPVVAYFLEANPRWREGAELACLAHMHGDNLTPIARRLLRGAR